MRDWALMSAIDSVSEALSPWDVTRIDVALTDIAHCETSSLSHTTNREHEAERVSTAWAQFCARERLCAGFKTVLNRLFASSKPRTGTMRATCRATNTSL